MCQVQRECAKYKENVPTTKRMFQVQQWAHARYKEDSEFTFYPHSRQ